MSKYSEERINGCQDQITQGLYALNPSHAPMVDVLEDGSVIIDGLFSHEEIAVIAAACKTWLAD